MPIKATPPAAAAAAAPKHLPLLQPAHAYWWLHPPKTGSFFAVAVSDLICDALRAASGDHGFAKKQGTVLPRGRTRCAATGYFGRPVGVSLLPHALAGPELSFADGHYPSTFDGAKFAVPTLAWVRTPGPRLRAQFAQGMTRWRAGRGRVVRGRFDARGGSPRGARPRVERASAPRSRSSRVCFNVLSSASARSLAKKQRSATGGDGSDGPPSDAENSCAWRQSQQQHSARNTGCGSRKRSRALPHVQMTSVVGSTSVAPLLMAAPMRRCSS